MLIGGSYIGCEVAASLTMLGKRCSIVMQEQVTLERGFGAQAGRFFQELLEDARRAGSTAATSSPASRATAASAKVVHASAASSSPAEAVVIGAGVSPDVQLARSAGLEIGERGGVRCSLAPCRARRRACSPRATSANTSPSSTGARRLRIEHWDVAFNQGKTAALNMLGRDVPHEVVPYFYSVLGDWGELEYVGPAHEWDEEIVRGSTEPAASRTGTCRRRRSRRRSRWGAPTTSITPAGCSPPGRARRARIATCSPTPTPTSTRSAPDRSPGHRRLGRIRSRHRSVVKGSR